MRKITLKFGGTSLASSANIQKVKEIIDGTEGVKYIVVSAPGKRFSGDIKVTDLLINAYENKDNKKLFNQLINKIAGRFEEIIFGLNINFALKKEISIIKNNIKTCDLAYAASRGEYLMGKIMAAYLNMPYVEAAKVIVFNKQGVFNYTKSARLIKRQSNTPPIGVPKKYPPETFWGKRGHPSILEGDLLAASHLKVGGCSFNQKNSVGAVIPGFYGADELGRIFTFSRGGSDFTGSVVAAATQSEEYQNWTDVGGVLTADPKIVSDTRPISTLSFRCLRDLSYMGAGVLHADCVFPLAGRNIPIIIKNTFNPEGCGTTIAETADNREKNNICGVTGRKNLIKITIEKPMLKNKLEIISRLLSITEKYNLVPEHILTGVDSISLIIEEQCFVNTETRLIKDICRLIKPNTLTVKKDFAIVAVVGEDLMREYNLLPKIFAALADDNIEVGMVVYGSSGSNILIGVEGRDFERTIKGIHKRLFES